MTTMATSDCPARAAIDWPFQRTESMKAVKQSSLDHEITRHQTAEREDDKGVHGRKKQLGLTRSSSTSLDPLPMSLCPMKP